MKRLLLSLLLIAIAFTTVNAQVEICDNGIDDNGNGLIDCEDSSCSSLSFCNTERCDNGIDDDGDGFIDSEDSDCDATPAEICDNGIDDDGDGLTDCEDSDCRAATTCQTEICDNGVDDDNDGFIDYYDGDCLLTPRKSDSLALVAFYYATDGDHWTRNDNWLTGPTDTWYGVNANEGRVYGIELIDNNLQGALPEQVNNLSSLHYFNFSDNDIDSLPADLFYSSGAQGHMYGNRLTFEDIIDQPHFFAKIDPQQPVGKDTTIVISEGQSFTIDLGIDQNIPNNQYVWFKDQIAIGTTNTNQFTVPTSSTEDEGIYTCKISNPDGLFPDLLLFSNPVSVSVEYDGRSTSKQDSLMLVELYHATNGDHWTRNDNWLTGPVDTWYGVYAWTTQEAPDTKSRVHWLLLADNQLEGKLPSNMRYLTFMNRFDVSRNKLTGMIPAIKTYPHFDSVSFTQNSFTSVSSEIEQLPNNLIIAQNHLTFEDLLPLLAKDSIHYSGDHVWYEHIWGYDQKLISRDTTVIIEEINDYTIDLSIDLTIDDNEYVWFKDSIAIDTTNVSYYILTKVSIKDSGLYTCQVTNPAAAGVTLYSGTVHLQVTTERRPQTITFDSLPNRTVNDSLLVLEALATSALPISYRITEGEGMVASLQGDTITIVGAGTVTVEARQEGDEYYLSATSVTRSFDVTKLSQHIAFIELGDVRVYDTLTLSASANSGLPVHFSIIGAAQLNDNQLVLTDTGQVTITAQQAGNDFYTAADPVMQTVRVAARPEEVPSTYYVSGSIWRNEQVPQSGATVLLFQRNDDGRYLLRTQAFLEGHRYRFDSLSEGFYTLGAVVPDTSYLPTYQGGQYLLLNAEALYLGENTEGLDITLLTAPVRPARGNIIIRGTLVGRISEPNGRTSYTNNEPLPNVHVYLQNALTGQLIAHTVTDNTGQFEFAGLPKGKYQLVADCEGGASSEILSVSDYQEVAVVATVTDKLTITSEAITNLITSTNEKREVESVKLFPNPVTDQLTVEIGSSRWTGGIISIQDILGCAIHQAAIQRPTVIFDMTGQKAGVYVLTIRKDKEVVIRRIIK